MISTPLVSIVVPAFNPRFFQKALQSALSQSYRPVEIIVCDDCRSDEIRDITQACVVPDGMSLRYVHNPQRLGFVGNLLKCLSEARGEFIKFLCDDDMLFNACIEMQVSALTDNDDANLVLGQRYFLDENDYRLPSRLENTALCDVSGLFKGGDLLVIFEGYPCNLLGGLSSALFRRQDVLEILPALAQEGHGFNALLDLALYVCLLRRGNLIALSHMLSVERIHPERLQRQQAFKDATVTEMKWLVEMLKQRGGEREPAQGWVRYIELSRAAEQPRVWSELPLGRSLGNRQAFMAQGVGVTSQSFAEFYVEWLGCRTLSQSQRRQLPDLVGGWRQRPKIVPIIIDEVGSRARLDMTLHSLSAQFYAPERVLVLSNNVAESSLNERVLSLPLQDDWVQQLNEVLSQQDGAQWFYLLRAGDRPVRTALLVMADRIVNASHAHCLYSDEGALREGESVDPVFKPDFNLSFMRSYPYVGRALAFRRESFLELGGFNALYGELAPHDLLWRLAESKGDVVLHIPEVLLESTFSYSQWLASAKVLENNQAVLAAHLTRLGVAYAIDSRQDSLINHVTYLQDDQPLVSIIILCRDQLAVLQRCLETLVETTAYRQYEVLIVNNGSQDAVFNAWLDGIRQLDSNRLRVLHAEFQPNISALYNHAAQNARGQYLLMLNPYAVVTQPHWLDAMLNEAQRPEVGVLGAKLLSPEGSVIQGGLLLGLGGTAGVAFYGESRQAPGYMQRLQIVHDLSAVSGDCLMIRASVFHGVGGLDEASLSQGLNHVDLCLRVRQSGYLVVWTPYACLALGAQPVLSDEPPLQELRKSEQDLFIRRWLPVLARDPAYNPNLNLGSGSFTLEPGVRTGWTPFSDRKLPSVLVLPINTSAVGHYRMSQPFIELEEAGRVVGKIAYHTPSLIEIERQSPDVIVLQGRYYEGPAEEIATFKNCFNARRIYELDDYVINVPHKNGHSRNMPADMESIVRRGISLCDRVVVSTQPLADALSSMHQDIRVVPNMLAQHFWLGLQSQRRASNKPRVGWGGGTSHTGDLEVIAEVVRTLADEVEWVFFGMCPPDLEPFVHEFHRGIGLAEYPAKLASLNLDLALAPLEQHIFNDCKSNLRLLEYGACGYPVICTDTLAYRGYLPCTRVVSNSTEEWLEAIRMHLADPDASYRMGDELREIVLRDYMLRGDNLQNWVHGWLDD